MDVTTAPWIGSMAGAIASGALWLFVGVNVVFGLGLFLTRNRQFIDRWTKTLVVTDALLLTAAVGAPVVSVALNLGAKGLLLLASPFMGLLTPAK